MIEIDGSQGEGGGQIVRSSLTLSAITSQPIKITNLRSGRKKPGLKRQHLTAVRAAAKICGAAVHGDVIGSKQLRFEPQEVAAGDYHFRVGTAGSATLVLQTVLPALLTAGGESRITLEGGTHNPWAPPFDFLAKAYLPLLNRMGPHVEATLLRPGFYPAGGGRFVVAVQPREKLASFDLIDRGPIKQRRVIAMVANLPLHIAKRECDTIARKSGWGKSLFEAREVSESSGPGNVVMIEVECEHVTEVFVGFGERGVPAEKIATRVWKEAKSYLESDVPVGPHLADQLMLPFGLAAHQGAHGAFRTMAMTPHSTTHIEILRTFLDVEINKTESAPNDVTVSFARRG